MKTELEKLLDAEAATNELLAEVERARAEVLKYGAASKALAQTREDLGRLIASLQDLVGRANAAVTATKDIGTPALLEAQQQVASSVDRLAGEVKATSERELKSVASEVAGVTEKLSSVAQQVVVSTGTANDGMLAKYTARIAELGESLQATLNAEVRSIRDAEESFRASIAANIERGIEDVSNAARASIALLEQGIGELRDAVVANIGDGLREMKSSTTTAISAAGSEQRDAMVKLQAEVAELRNESTWRQRTVIGLFIANAVLVALVGLMTFPAVRSAIGLP